MWIENRPRGLIVVLEPQSGHFLAMWLCGLSGGPEASMSVTGLVGAARGPLGGHGYWGLSRRPDAAPSILRGLPHPVSDHGSQGVGPRGLDAAGFLADHVLYPEGGHPAGHRLHRGQPELQAGA